MVGIEDERKTREERRQHSRGVFLHNRTTLASSFCNDVKKKISKEKDQEKRVSLSKHLHQLQTMLSDVFFDEREYVYSLRD